MKKFCLLLLAVFMAFNISAEINIIPKPQSVTPAEGSFSLAKAKKIAYAPDLNDLAQYLADVVSGSTGMDLSVTPNAKGADIILKTDGKKVSAAEGYILEVTPDKIVITGADKGGVFYGIQSLLQLFPPQIYSQRRVKGVEWTAPCVTVIDSPARPYRGMLLDVARYFHDKDYVKHFIDMMATYKMNKLQFHLIDDSGWRLESEKYPRLVEMGAYSGDNAHRLGGYYTKDDIKELIDYAALRNVEIIPEIEFPAHILSAIVAYPWLSCTGQQHELPS